MEDHGEERHSLSTCSSLTSLHISEGKNKYVSLHFCTMWGEFTKGCDTLGRELVRQITLIGCSIAQDEKQALLCSTVCISTILVSLFE